MVNGTSWGTGIRRLMLGLVVAMTSLPALAWDIEIPDRDYGLWVPDGHRCTSPTRIEVRRDELAIQGEGERRFFTNGVVILTWMSGTAVGDRLEHMIRIDLDDHPTFQIGFFLDEDENIASYEYIGKSPPPFGLHRGEVRFHRCPRRH
jgi:hypothetical protein